MILAFEDYELDEELLELRRDGVRVPTQPKVLDLLFMLVRARGRVVTKREILEALWPGVLVSDTALARTVMGARRAIGDGSSTPRAILTVRGRGAHFALGVEERAARSVPRLSSAPPSRVPLIGRDACMALLTARLDDALAGRAGAACLAGEAGIGKTRVQDELSLVARARGATTISARAYEGDGAPRYWPWTQIARALEADRPPDPAAAASTREGEFTLADEMARCLTRASARVPLVLLFDDLQWGDDASLRVLVAVARALRDARVLVVGAYRDGASSDAPSQALGAFARECSDHLVTLRGLEKEDVGRLVAALCGTAPSRELLAVIHEKTAGNPLYVAQLGATRWLEDALTQPDRALASSLDLELSVVASIERHLAELAPECKDLLATAAVLGSPFGLSPLAHAMGEAPLALLDRLDAAVRARIILKSSQTVGQYRFVHALVRDVIHKKMPGTERVARHRAVAAALIAHGEELHLTAVADHLLRAAPGGDVNRAIDWALRAAAREVQTGDPREAMALLERARSATDLDGGARRGEVERALEEARAWAARREPGGGGA